MITKLALLAISASFSLLIIDILSIEPLKSKITFSTILALIMAYLCVIMAIVSY